MMAQDRWRISASPVISASRIRSWRGKPKTRAGRSRKGCTGSSSRPSFAGRQPRGRGVAAARPSGTVGPEEWRCHSISQFTYYAEVSTSARRGAFGRLKEYLHHFATNLYLWAQARTLQTQPSQGKNAEWLLEPLGRARHSSSMRFWSIQDEVGWHHGKTSLYSREASLLEHIGAI